MYFNGKCYWGGGRGGRVGVSKRRRFLRSLKVLKLTMIPVVLKFGTKTVARSTVA